MTDLIPLTGNDLEILRRLNAGQHPAHIADIGWYRQSWSPADIARVDAHRQLLEAVNAADRKRAAADYGPPVTRDVCGTTAGEYQHRKRHERVCDDCKRARNEYMADRRRKLAGDAA